jgi:hypothetical protein
VANPQNNSDGLRLEWLSPAELAENPRNWRTHPPAQVAALTDALSEVGWAGACLYNERTGRLIDGHARKKVALDQGSERVPVLVGSWSEEQEAKILATLDPLAAMAEADAAKLDALLRDVQTGSEALSQMIAELAQDAGVVPKFNGEAVDDPAGEWQGMPEFIHEDKTAYRSIVVHLADEDAVRDFCERMEQGLSAEAKYIYHPRRDRAEHAGERYADES